MVFRTATIHLLVAVLLVCPYVCFSGAAEGQASQAGRQGRTKRACCHCCCSGPCSDNGKDKPGKQDSRPKSGTCLCHGAVMDRAIAMPDPGYELVAFLPPDAAGPLRESFGADDGFLSRPTACHFAGATSGRMLRALVESYLL
jgi:hypothetical protein